MKRWSLFTAIFQTTVGVAAIIAYIFIAISGESIGKWTVTLLLAIAFAVIGVINAIEYKKSDDNTETEERDENDAGKNE